MVTKPAPRLIAAAPACIPHPFKAADSAQVFNVSVNNVVVNNMAGSNVVASNVVASNVVASNVAGSNVVGSNVAADGVRAAAQIVAQINWTNFWQEIEKEGRNMNSQTKLSTARYFQWVAVVVLVVSVFFLGCSKKETTKTAQTPQNTFATAAEAGQALQTAVKAKDDSAIAQILGPKAKMLVSSGDATENAAAIDSFAKKYDRMNRWVAMTDGSQVLYIGADNYPFPIPLAQDSSLKWHFDANAGDEELRARRIGRNELLAMDACRSIANAEELYRQRTHRYTDTIISTPGKQDGLYWEVSDDEVPSPLGRVNGFAKGIFVAGAPSKSPVFNGYTFRIVSAQADGAKGGMKGYFSNGKLTGGFAVVASPVDYQQSGIMTFILGRDGTLYQQDLGSQTEDVAASIEKYNPTDGWAQAE
jgi:preprotein translocase subunit SecE